MLVFIVIALAAQIAVQILFHVALSIVIAIRENDKDGEKTKRIVRVTKGK